MSTKNHIYLSSTDWADDRVKLLLRHSDVDIVQCVSDRLFRP